MSSPVTLASAILLSAAPQLGWASCAGQQLLSCRVEGSAKVVDMCLTEDELVYRFGRPDAPEIELSAPLSDGTFRPWNGIGRELTTSVRFTNGDHSYDVWWSADRLAADRPVSAGVTVFQSDRYLAQIECAPETVGDSFEPPLTDAMRRRGLCWSAETQTGWTQCD